MHRTGSRSTRGCPAIPQPIKTAKGRLQPTARTRHVLTLYTCLEQRPAACSDSQRGMMSHPAVVYEDLLQKCTSAGQQHILADWDSLNDIQQQQLAAEIRGLDFDFISRTLQASQAAVQAANHTNFEPVNDVITLQDADSTQRAEWSRLGLSLIAQGRIGVVLLAGGQGTRLGSNAPKGCYDVGLPSHKSLFQLQAERLLAVQRLAAAAAAAHGGSSVQPVRVPWFIMTSQFTHQDTMNFFEKHTYFGLDQNQVIFFQQGFMTCLAPEGKVIMESPCKIAKNPDGNGGLYRALRSSGTLTKMQQMGLEALDVYSVDNILARVADPEWLGCCHSRGSQLGCKVLAKTCPEERVGVFAREKERLQVLEYSELDPEKASAIDPATGNLYFNWSNICMHYFSIPWLAAAADHLAAAATYHVAHKQIPSKGGGKVAGVKLEMFIFDPFGMADKTTLFEVAREDHFSPVKNASGSATDTPDTARAALLAQGTRWVVAAGGRIAEVCAGLEVSPLVSYAGEGLESVVEGKVVGQGQNVAHISR